MHWHAARDVQQMGAPITLCGQGSSQLQVTHRQGTHIHQGKGACLQPTALCVAPTLWHRSEQNQALRHRLQRRSSPTAPQCSEGVNVAGTRTRRAPHRSRLCKEDLLQAVVEEVQVAEHDRASSCKGVWPAPEGNIYRWFACGRVDLTALWRPLVAVSWVHR